MRACALEYELDGSAQHPGAHTMLLLSWVYVVYKGDAGCVDEGDDGDGDDGGGSGGVFFRNWMCRD